MALDEKYEETIAKTASDVSSVIRQALSLTQTNSPMLAQCKVDLSSVSDCSERFPQICSRGDKSCLTAVDSFATTRCKSDNKFCDLHLKLMKSSCSSEFGEYSPCLTESENAKKWCLADRGNLSILCNTLEALVTRGDVDRFELFHAEILPMLEQAYTCWKERSCDQSLSSRDFDIARGFYKITHWLVNFPGYQGKSFKSLLGLLGTAACSCDTSALAHAILTIAPHIS